MASLHRGSSAILSNIRPSARKHLCNRCSATFSTSISKSAEGENAPPTPRKPATTRRQASQNASRMIAGLPGAAPSGSAKGPNPTGAPSTTSSPQTAAPAAPRFRIIREPSGRVQTNAPMIRRDVGAAPPLRPGQRRTPGGGSRGGRNRPVELSFTEQAEQAAARAQALPPPPPKGVPGPLKQTDEDKAAHVRSLEEAAIKEAATKVRIQRRGAPYEGGVELNAVSGDFKKMVQGLALAGQYDAFPAAGGAKKGKTSPKDTTTTSLRTSLQLNDTYSPTRRDAFIKVVEKRWPQQQARR